MIKNWKQHELYMDFSKFNLGNGKPSDIDMFYIGKNNTLVIGEIKNEIGHLADTQRHLMEELVDGWKYNAFCVFIQHSEYVEYGSSNVDVANSYVTEYYMNGTWTKLNKPINANDAIDTLINFNS